MSKLTDEISMSADVIARRWLGRLEQSEAQRSGAGLASARHSVARRLGLPAGTLENIRRGRSKSILVWVQARLQAAIVRELEAEIARCRHELDLAYQSGARPGSPEMLEAEAHLVAAREALTKDGR